MWNVGARGAKPLLPSATKRCFAPLALPPLPQNAPTPPPVPALRRSSIWAAACPEAFPVCGFVLYSQVIFQKGERLLLSYFPVFPCREQELQHLRKRIPHKPGLHEAGRFRRIRQLYDTRHSRERGLHVVFHVQQRVQKVYRHHSLNLSEDGEKGRKYARRRLIWQ